jgi:hypothetical protein
MYIERVSALSFSEFEVAENRCVGKLAFAHRTVAWSYWRNKPLAGGLEQITSMSFDRVSFWRDRTALISSFKSQIMKSLRLRSQILLTLRETSFSTWPGHFSQDDMDATSVIIFGRRVRPASMIPRSAACASRREHELIKSSFAGTLDVRENSPE